MANMDSLTELDKAIKEFQSVDIDRLKRPSLGEESLANDIVSRLTPIEKFVDQARRYAQLVNDAVVHDVRNTIAHIAQAMNAHAVLESSQYIEQKAAFLQGLDDQIEESKNWQPTLAGAAVFDRGLLDDEGVKHASDLALEHLKKTTAETLATIQTEAEKAIQGAKNLADEIEAKARLTASQISVKEAQRQFKDAADGDKARIKLWGWLTGVSVALLVGGPLLFTQWELPAGAEWPVALYHTLLRVLALSAIAGIAAFGFKVLRAHLHLAEKNRHRVRVANCVESFVQSALEPAQRDLILAKLVDSIVSFGDSGLIQHGGDDRSSPMSGDVIGRIVAAISSKGSS